MALRDQDYRELLEHLRRQVRRMGLSSLDDQLFGMDRPDIPDPLQDLRFYLKRLAEYVSLRSRETYSRTLSRLQDNVQTETGEPIAGIDLQMVGPDVERFGTRILTLEGSPRELDEVTSELHAILDLIYLASVEDDLSSDWDGHDA